MLENEALSLPETGCNELTAEFSVKEDQRYVAATENCCAYNEDVAQEIEVSSTAGNGNSVNFHLRFDYFNKVKNEWCSLPEGLHLKAFFGERAYTATTTVKDGIYEVCVPTHPGETHDAADLHFTFEAPLGWIYTKDKESTPKFVGAYNDIDESLPETAITRGDLAYRQLMVSVNFYDLPEKWDSDNWICSCGNKRGSVAQFITDPTTAATPLTFCLDDIVLTDRSLQQGITDQSVVPDTVRQNEFDLKRQRGTPKPLTETSRAVYLCFASKSKQLQLYSSAPDGSKKERHDGSIFRFACSTDGVYRNYLHRPPAQVRAVLFCGEVYDVTMWRTKVTVQEQHSAGLVCGARAAVRNDQAVHYGKTVVNDDTTHEQHYPQIGNHDMHYLHNCGIADGVVYGALVVYRSSFFLKTAGTNRRKTRAESVTTAATDVFQNAAIENVMEQWNGKDYQFIDTAGRNNLVIHPLFIFEAEETQVESTKDTDTTDSAPFAGITTFKNSLTKCSGGVPMSISFIADENRKARSSRNHLELTSTVVRNNSGTTDEIQSNNSINSECDTGFDSFVLAYKLSRATRQTNNHKAISRWKNYLGKSRFALSGLRKLYKKKLPARINNGHSRHLPDCSDSVRFPFDTSSTMNLRHQIRMRDIWRFVNWLNDNCARTDTIGRFLTGQQFTVVSQYSENGMIRKMYYYNNDCFKKDPWALMERMSIPVTVDRPENMSASTAILTRLRCSTERMHISKVETLRVTSLPRT